MREVLAESGSGSHFTWIDITQPTIEELNEVSREFNLHEYTVRDCLEPDHLPKFELFENTKFLITRLYAPKNQPNPHTIQELTTKIAIFYTNTFIITIHRKILPFIHIIRDQCFDSEHCSTPGDLITKILWNSLHTYELPALDLGTRIDYYEEEIFLKNHIPNIQKSLYFLKRKAASCKKVILLTTDVINKSHSGVSSNPSLQDLFDLHLKLMTQYDQIMDDANNLLNIYIALASQKTNEVVKILTIFSVFFLPLTFIVGIYGMNFDFMPELHSKWGYPGVLLFMLLVTLFIYYWFRHKRLIRK
jgi:magnesium transporter